MTKREKERFDFESYLKFELKKIYEEYHKVYPKGKYLTMVIIDGNMYAHNEYWKADKKFEINFFEEIKDGTRR